MSTIADLVLIFTNEWNWGLSVTLSGILALFLKDYLERPADRAILDQYLASRRWTTIYGEYLSRALDAIDRLLKPQVVPYDKLTDYDSRRAWSWPLMDLTLRLALLYPLLTLIIAWALGGATGRIGNFDVLPSEALFQRVQVVLLLIILSWYLYCLRPKKLASPGWAVGAMAFAIAFGLILLMTYWGAFVFGAIIAFASAFGLAPIQGVFAIVGIIFCFVGFFLTSGAGAIVIISVGAVAFALLGGLVRAGTLESGLIVGLLSIGLVSFGVLVFTIFRKMIERTIYRLTAYFLLIGVLGAAVTATFALAPPITEVGRMFLIFLAILPLFNAMFDFFSIGITRWLLRRGAVSGGKAAIGWALLDLLAAAVLFAILGIALISYFHWLNGRSRSDVLDIEILFTDIRADPRGYWWLYAMVFTTIVPTIAHFVVASFSFIIAFMPNSIAGWIRRQLNGIERSAVPLWAAWFVLSTLGAVGIAAVVHVFWVLFLIAQYFLPELGFAYLFVFELYAEWLGAPVVPITPTWLRTKY